MQILFVKLCVCSVAESSLFVTPWTVALQVPLSMGFLQARILEWVAISSCRRSFRSRDRVLVSCLLHWQADFLPPGKPYRWERAFQNKQQRCVPEFCCCFCFWLCRVLVAASGSSSLIRDQTPSPLHGEHGVLTTGPSGSPSPRILSSLFFLFPLLTFFNFNALISNTL